MSSVQEVKIRSLEPEQAQQVFDLVARAREFLSFPFGREWPLRVFSKELAYGQGLGAFQGQQLVGFVLYRRQDVAIDISLLATDPDFEGQGVMSRLLRQLEAMRMDHQELWLEVHEKNGVARNYYESFGFEPGGLRKGYYPDGAAALNYSLPARANPFDLSEV